MAVAGDPDALAGGSNDGADGWAAARIVALLLGGLVIRGLGARSRLDRSGS